MEANIQRKKKRKIKLFLAILVKFKFYIFSVEFSTNFSDHHGQQTIRKIIFFSDKQFFKENKPIPKIAEKVLSFCHKLCHDFLILIFLQAHLVDLTFLKL